MITVDSLTGGKDKIAVVGLGYVGLPLAVQLADHFRVVGFDLKKDRIEELKSGHDRTLEVSDPLLAAARVTYTLQPGDLSACRLIIIAVPTPIDENHTPDLGPLRRASEIVGANLSKGSCVVFESTVYPGATEDVCVPILEHRSGFRFGTDFTVGYSPERINPGDTVHTIDKIIKIVSGSDGKTLSLLDAVYGKVVKAGIHKTSSIKVAEAAKVIENTQRDLNIALMNELAMIFDKIGIDTIEVLNAAETKWNFLPFRPGLVGGHCIGVDPYYLTVKAESLGYHPDMILAGRRINDGMSKFISDKAVKMIIGSGKRIRGARVAVLGITFKEDVPDLRNTKVVDIVRELQDFGIEVSVNDPIADAIEAAEFYHIELQSWEVLKGVDAVIVAVKHEAYKKAGMDGIAALCTNGVPIIIDVKGMFDPTSAENKEMHYWRL